MIFLYYNYGDENEGIQHDIILRLIKDDKIKEISQFEYMFNPKLEEEESNFITEELKELNNYSIYDNIYDYIDNSIYEGQIEVESMYRDNFSLSLAEVIEENRDYDIPYSDELNMYCAENPYDKLVEFINDLGRVTLEERLNALLEEVNNSSFNLL